MTALTNIEGIDKGYAIKLKTAGVKSVELLLEICGDSTGRLAIANSADISEKMLLEWVNRADLSRIKGISSQYADLLEKSGVDSVVELARRNAANLCEKVKLVNREKSIVRRVPPIRNIEYWIYQANTMPKAVFH